MVDQRRRRYNILSLGQAILDGLAALIVFATYGLKPETFSDAGAVILSLAIMSTAGVIYYATIHQVLAKNHLALSASILTLVSVTNAMLIIISTGGLDSPYYSLWLLAIVAAGIFGRIPTIVIVTLSLGYFIHAGMVQGIEGILSADHVVILVITIVAAGLAEWVHSRNRRAGAGAAKSLAGLTGQLTTEQLKANAIIASIGEGVAVVDADRRIQLFNKAAQELTGWDEDSAEGIDCNVILELKTSDDKEVNSENDPFTKSWNKGTTTVCDNLTITTRAGRKIQISLSISPIFNDTKQPSGAIALFRDISAEKEITRQKDEFVSTASHEMRTPVASIEGYISLAMNSNVATIDDRAREYLGKAHDTIQHLGGLFRDLLSAAKAEEGQLGGRIEPVNLGELLQSVVDDMQFVANKKKLTVVYQPGGLTGKTIAPLYYVAANPERLREVVMNLIDNAVKFTNEGGIRVTLEGDDQNVTVGVADTGLGIASEDIPHLFQKFYRIDSSATRTIGGTGLGLYLCRQVIELFNGRIWVESKSGEGSTFYFSLPRLSQADVSRMGAESTPSAGAAPPPQPTAGTLIKPEALPPPK